MTSRYLTLCLYICLLVFRSFCPFVFLSVCLFVFLSFFLSDFCSFCLFVFLSVFLSFCLSVFLSFLPFHPDITLIKCEKRLKSLSRSLCPNSKFYVLRWPLIIFFEVLWTWLWDVGIVEMLADVSEFQFFKDICLLRLRCVQSFTMITVFCLKV